MLRSVHRIIEPLVRIGLNILKIDFLSIHWVKDSSVLSMDHTIEHINDWSLSLFLLLGQESLIGSIIPVFVTHIDSMTVPLESLLLLKKSNWLTLESGFVSLDVVIFKMDLGFGVWVVNMAVLGMD